MIKKLTSGQYQSRCRENGKQLKRRFRTKKAAEEFELAVKNREERRRNGLPVPSESLTYRQLVEKVQSQRPGTGDRWYGEMISYSVKRFGSVLLADLRAEEIGAWLAALMKVRKPTEPLATKTKKHIRDAMRQTLDYAVEWGYLARNPSTGRGLPRQKTTPPKVNPFNSWEEVKRVAAATPGYAALITFACATGLRPEEWIALTWADVDFKKRTCRINKVVVDGKLRTSAGKTDAACRTVMLPKRAINALKRLPRPIDSESLIFPAPKGGYIDLDNWRARVWKGALEDTGVEYRPLYQMRHTYATLALAAGADIYWVSKQLGHTNIQTTLKHYARFLASVDERNLKLLDEFAA
jgi:integrase